jgi:exodeoxyribonuclease-3
MKLLSWNVNGIRAVLKKGALEPVFDLAPDILGLQEIKAKEDKIPDELKHIPGYHAYFYSADRPGYSGTALYTKIKPLSVTYGLGIEHLDTEGRVITAEYENFVFITCYFPNGARSQERLDHKMEFYDAFLQYVNQFVHEGKKVIFCGDVNTAHTEIDLARPKENEQNSGFLPQEREWIDDVIQSGYIDTFRMVHPEKAAEYSYWDQVTRARDRNVGWRIDYFFVSQSVKPFVKDAFILQDIYGSDHCPVGIEIAF